MPICTFFGHRDCPETIRQDLQNTIIEQIKQGVDTFYVGNHGRFDGMVRSVLSQLSHEYPHIRFAVVLAYLPTEKRDFVDYGDTMYPEGLENIPPKFAITHRNNWMVDVSDCCVCYIQHTWGGAHQAVQRAKRKGKRVINLYEQ